MQGEAVSSGSLHVDNISPSLFGGLVLTVGIDNPRVKQIPVPNGIRAILVHPHLFLSTKQARGILKPDVKMSDFIWQTANLAGFISRLLLERSRRHPRLVRGRGHREAAVPVDSRFRLRTRGRHGAGRAGLHDLGRRPVDVRLVARLPTRLRARGDGGRVQIRRHADGFLDRADLVDRRACGRMKYISTRGHLSEGKGQAVSFSEAVAQGLAPDGGLYMPESWPTLSIADFEGATTLPEVAEIFLRPFVAGDPIAPQIGDVVRDAFTFRRH